MNVIVAGAGEVGGHAAEVLSSAGHKVTVIDLSSDRLRYLSDTLDVRTLRGHCAHIDILRDAGAEHGDILIATTQHDEINLLCALLGKAAGTRKVIVRVHHGAHFALHHTKMAEQLGIDELICPEHLMALEAARTLRNPGAIAIEEFGRGQIVIQRIGIDATSASVGKKLMDLALPSSVRVATVERGESAMVAQATTVVEAGDFITLIGDAKRFDIARKMFHKGKAKHQNIVIMGDTDVAVWLCSVLKSRIFSVRLFAQNRQRAEELSIKLDHVTVLEADPTDRDIFTDERIDSADAFIAATDDDEHNILACAQATSLGVGKTIAVLQRSKYLHLLPHVGISQAFSPREVAVRAMMKLIEDHPIRSLATFAGDIAEVYEIRVGRDASAVDCMLRAIKLPPLTMVAAIHRGDDVIVPGADDKVLYGDTILVIGRPGLASELSKLFVSK